jgi:bromodomain adjacent to zinc finger domain protein 1A
MILTVKVLAAAADKREREASEKAEKQKLAKDEAERIVADKKKKKPVRYPTEDLDVRLSDKERKAGMRVQRPLPNRDIPFQDNQGTFESFLMAWNFLVVYGYVEYLALDCLATVLMFNELDNHFICLRSPSTNSSMLYAILSWIRSVPSLRRFTPPSYTTCELYRSNGTAHCVP